MKGYTLNKLRKGLIKRLHVNQPRLRANLKHQTDLPILTIQCRGGPFYADEIEIDGPSKLVYRPDKPLSCGARCWIETKAAITYTGRSLAPSEEETQIET